MRIPAAPKPLNQLLAGLKKERFGEIFQIVSEVQSKDRYLPWDELRRRPAPAGLTHDEWWLLIKFGRSGKLRPIPLHDKSGTPFQFAIPDQLLEQLHNIDCGLGANWNVPDAVAQPSSRNEYIVSTLMQEAITSSQLEGAATTRQVAKELLRSGRAPRDKSEQMILNNYLTMQRIIALRKSEITPELIFQLHGQVTHETLDQADAAGRFRRAEENVRVEDGVDGTVYHEPPLAEELPTRMQAMCDFANGKTPSFFIHPVIRAIILHFWLAYDHPFVDGNGRTARALFYWAMLHQKFQLFEFISISQILLKAPLQYAGAFLHTETDDNDLTYFILHQSAVIEQAAKALHEYVELKKTALKATESTLLEINVLNHRQRALLTHALREPGERFTIRAHQRSLGIAYQTARTDLLELASLGLLVPKQIGKTINFRIPRDLEQTLAKLAPEKS